MDIKSTPEWFYNPIKFVEKTNELATIWTVQIWQAKMTLAANATQSWINTFFPTSK